MRDIIYRQAAIDAIDRLDIPEDMCVFEILSHIELEIGTLPFAQPETCAYWDSENNFCALHRPSAQPDNQETINDPKMTGWICPVCGRGLSPYISVCPCKEYGKKWEVTC